MSGEGSALWWTLEGLSEWVRRTTDALGLQTRLVSRGTSARPAMSASPFDDDVTLPRKTRAASLWNLSAAPTPAASAY